MESALAYSRARIGQPDRHGWLLEEARVEGRTLVLVFTPPAAGTGGMGVEDYGASVAIGMCQAPRGSGFFADGRTLRVDVREDGRPDGSVTISACPGRNEATRIMARNIQRLAGERLGPLTIAGARAEGTELVILIDGAAGWRRGLSLEQLNTLFFRGYCETRTRASIWMVRARLAWTPWRMALPFGEGGRSPAVPPIRAADPCPELGRRPEKPPSSAVAKRQRVSEHG